MGLTLFIFMPVSVCLFWILVHAVTASRTDSFGLFFCLFLSCCVFIHSEASYEVAVPDTVFYISSQLAGLFAGPCLLPLIILYFRKLISPEKNRPHHFLWIVVPVILFTSGAILQLLKGIASVEEAYSIVTGPVYNAVLGLELIFFVVFVIRVFRGKLLGPGTIPGFLLRGQTVSLLRLQMSFCTIPAVLLALRVCLSTNLYTLQSWIPVVCAILVTASVFLFGLCALFGTRERVCLKDFSSLLRFNYGAVTKADSVESMMVSMLDEAEEEALKRIQEKIGSNLHLDMWRRGEENEQTPLLASQIFKAVAEDWDEDSLMSRFQHLMMDEQLFLQPQLSLGDVAERLNSNKTYVSKMVNNTYNHGFPELINILRIDYAEQYILNHREAKQTEIANKCGFLSASAFNNMFKKVTGMTPKAWIASMDRSNEL